MTLLSQTQEIIKKKYARNRKKALNIIKLLTKKISKEKVKLPNSIIEELQELGEIGDALTPSIQMHIPLEGIILFEERNTVKTIEEFLNLKEEKYDILILIKSLKAGGISKILNSYINALKTIYKDIKILILANEYIKESVFTPKNTDIIYLSNLGNIKNNQTLYNKLINRLSIQLNINIIWNFNCENGYIYCKEPDANNRVRIWQFIFAHWINKSNKEFGFAHQYIPYIIDKSEFIISDNQYFVDYLCAQYNFSKDKFISLYAPYSKETVIKENSRNPKQLKVIWASNIEWNKGISLIPKIFNLINELPITIDIYGQTKNFEGENLLFKTILKSLLNKKIRFRGKFTNFKEIVEKEEYDCLLFTSFSEGMPNVVLESIESGLNIISPLVGGLNDILSEDNSYIIKDKHNENEYASELKKALEDKQNFRDQEKINKLIKEYKEKFSINEFKEKTKLLSIFS